MFLSLGATSTRQAAMMKSIEIQPETGFASRRTFSSNAICGKLPRQLVLNPPITNP